MRQVEVAAATFGLEVTSLEIRRAEDVAPAIEPLKGHADGLYVVTEALANTNRFEINSLALGARLSTMHAEKGYVEAGGLMSCGPSFPDLYQRAALYVDKILKGAKPADLPIEQPTRFEFVINMKTAKTLGLEIAPAMLARADETIE